MITEADFRLEKVTRTYRMNREVAVRNNLKEYQVGQYFLKHRAKGYDRVSVDLDPMTDQYIIRVTKFR